MSKTNQAAKPTAEQVNNALVLGSENLGITDAEAFAIIEAADESAMEDLTQEYFKFEQKGRYIFKVLGFAVAKINDNDVPVVEMQTKEGANVINGDAVLYSACRKLKQLPAFIIVNYVGDLNSKTGNGKYKDLRISTFPSGE